MIISDRFFYNYQSSLFASLLILLCLFFPGQTWAVSPFDVNVDVRATSSQINRTNLVTDQGTTGGPLTINRVELFFIDNQQGDITVSLNEEVKALAKIKYTGNGTLQWQWLVDGRVIQQGSRGLIYGSSLEITTDSIPPLPTFEPGQHHVSFRIVKPLVHFRIPPITYFVDTNTQLSQSNILLYSPTDDSWAKRSQLEFSWSPLPEGVLYQIDIWPLSEMTSESKLEDYRNQSSNKNLNTILQAQTRSNHYKPNPTQLEVLHNERLYEWQISAINEQGEVLAESITRLFRIRPEYDQSFTGGVFFRSTGITEQRGQDHSGIISTAGTTSSVVGSFSGRNAVSLSLLEESRNISFNLNVTGGQTIFINPRVENSTTHSQQNLTIEIKNGKHLIGRRIIPDLPAHSYFQLSHAWAVPILENQGQLTVTILEKETLLDQATINWKTETTSATSGLNFKEVAAIKPQIFPDLSCGVSTPFFVETITPPTDVLKEFPTLSSKLISARVTTMEKKSGERQEITDKGWFNDDEETSVSFIAEVTDNGFMDAYLKQKNLCGSWLRDMKKRLNSIANKLSPQPTRETFARPRSRQLSEQICSGKTGMEKVSCLESVSNSSHIRFSDEELEATADALRRAATFFDSKPFPDSFSLFFEIATATTSDKPSIIWKDSKKPIELRKGDQKTRHISSPIELPGTPGEFNVSISGISPQSPLYTTLDGGLPRFLEMAGFTLEVQEYYRQPNGALSGYAKTYWHGNLVNREIPLVFHDLTYTNDGSPLYAKVTSGQAELKGLETPLLGLGRDKEHSYPVILKKLELLADRAKADITFKLPEKFHAEEFSQINFTDVDILNGGEFLAEYQFPKSYKDMDIGRGDLDIRLAGSYILADFSEHISNSQVSQEPTWEGIILSGGAIRARVRERSDHPELGLMPAANRAYILGRFSRLELSGDGKLHGDVQLVRPTTIPAFFDQPTNHQIELLAPFDFKLEFLSGVFQISDDGVGGIDLAGRLTLPEEYDSAPLRFSHLTRFIVDGKPVGFHSEEITQNLPDLQLSGIPYTPASGTLIIPASLNPVITTSNARTPSSQQHRPEPWAWPKNKNEVSDWVNKQQGDMMAHTKAGGLFLFGGTFDLPWPEVPTPTNITPKEETETEEGKFDAIASRTNDQIFQGEETEPGEEMATTMATDALTLSNILKLANGVFCLDSTGVNGSWIQVQDRTSHLIGDFTANLDGVRLEFQKSSLVNSLVEGALVIPYPTLATFKFTATLDDDLQIILNDEGLKTPEEISLAYWHATLHPGPRLHLDRSGRKETIHIESASLRLDVSDEFGGQEFTIPDTDIPGSNTEINGTIPPARNSDPLRISLDIVPDGNIDNINMAIDATQPIQEAKIGQIASFVASTTGSNLLFMGQGFQPEALFGQDTPFQFRRYHGDHQPPPVGDPASDEWLIKITGKITTSLFGERAIRVHHTARGAKVPYISQENGTGIEVIDEAGDPFSRHLETGEEYLDIPIDAVIDKLNILKYVTRKLRFVNTYSLGQDFIDSVADSYNSSVESNNSSIPYVNNDSFDSTTFTASKSFIGITNFSILDIFQANGLSEAGIGDFKAPSGQNAPPTINTCQTNCSYEKIGFGAGVDVGKALLSAIRFIRVGAHDAGDNAQELENYLDNLLNLETGTSENAINLYVDYVSSVSNFIDLVVMAAGEAGSAGAISPALLDQIRISIGDGIALVSSALKTGSSIYIGNLDGTEYDLQYQAVACYEILLDTAEMLIMYDEFDPDDFAQLLLDAADQMSIFLVTMEAAHLGNIDIGTIGLDDVDFGSMDLSSIDFGSLGRIDPETMDLATMPHLSAPIIALNLGRIPIKIAKHYLKEGTLTPKVSLDIFHNAFGSSLGLLRFLENDGTNDQQQGSAPLNLDTKIYDFLNFSLELAHSITTKNFIGNNGEISTQQLLKILDTISEFICSYRNEISQGLGQAGLTQNERQNVKIGIAASRLVINNLSQLNEQLRQTSVIPPDKMVKDFIFPIIDTLIGKNGVDACSNETAGHTDCGELPQIGDDAKLAMAIVKETLQIAMEINHNEQQDPLAGLKHIKRYISIFENCDSIFGENSPPFDKIKKNIDDLIAIIEPLQNNDNDAKAALQLADVLMQIFEERADSMAEFSLDRQSRALLHTLRAVDNAGLTAIEKGNGYQPKDAIHSSRKILTQIPKFVDYGSLEYHQLDTGTAVLSEVLALIEKKNGEMDTLTADETLALAERTLDIVKERMGDKLYDQDKKNIQICLMVLRYSRLGLSKLGAGQKDLDDLFAAIQEILPSEKEMLAYMQAISQLLEEGRKNPDKGGQEGLAQLIRSMVEQALAQGVSSAAEKELRLALLYLNQIKSGNCQFLYTVDDTGELSYIKTTCDDGITREFNANDNLLTLTFPTGSQRYPYGGIEKHRISYNLDIAPYRVDLSKPAGDPDREQALQNICERLNPEDFDSATLMSLQSKTETGRVVSWKAIDGTLKIVQESSPSCQSTEIYSNVLNMPSFNSAGSPNISENYQLVGRTWYDNEKTSCFQWQQDNQHINRFWDNGNKTSYLYHGLTGQYPELDIVIAHKGAVVWNGKRYKIAYLANVNDPEKSTLEISDPASGSTDTVWVDTTGTTSYQFNPDNTSPPQHVTSQKKTIIVTGHTDVYDFEHQLFWRKTTPVELWEFYQIADTLPHPDRINVGQPPAQNIAADPQSYTLLVSMDGETAHNPDGTPLTEPLELPNGVTLRPGSLHISIDGIDFHSISNHVTSDMVNGLAVEKVTLESGMIMSRWTDNEGVKHLKEEVPGMDGLIRLEVHTEELTDGSVRETTTNRMQLPTTYIRRVRRGNQIERWTWKEGEQPAQHGEITTLGHYVYAVDADGNAITTLPELNPTGIGETLAVSLYLAAEAVVRALPAPTTIDQLINILKKIDSVLNLKTDGLEAGIASQIPNPMAIPGVRDRLSFIKASIYSNYVAGLIEEARKQEYSLAKLRGYLGQCPEIKKLEDAGNNVPKCETPPVGSRPALAEAVAVFAAVCSPANKDISFNLTTFNIDVIDILGKEYRVAKATYNLENTTLNRNLLLSIIDSAGKFGSDVLSSIVGSDEIPTMDHQVFNRTCLTLSQAAEQIVSDMRSQTTGELAMQRLLKIQTQAQVMICPSRKDIEENPGAYADLSGAGYNPDVLSLDFTLTKALPDYNQSCGGTNLSIESSSWSNRLHYGLCSSSTQQVLCYCNPQKIWYIVNGIKQNISNEIERVNNGEDDNIEYFENLSKLLMRLDDFTKGIRPLDDFVNSGIFGEETTSQQSWDHFCKTKFGYTKQELLASNGIPGYCTIAPDNPPDSSGSSPDSSGETRPNLKNLRNGVEAALTQGINAQEEKCKENQDITACANAARHRKRQKERIAAIEAESTAKAIEKKVTDELGSFCANAVDAENLLARLRRWQEVFHELHKQGFNDLNQYDNLIKLWLEKVVADIGDGDIGVNDINRIRCAINLSAQLGIIRITQPVEDFIAAHKDEFWENILYLAGWPGSIHVTFDSSDLVNIDINTSQGKQQLINMIREAYSSKRQTMFNEKTPLSLLRFNNISLAVSAMADKGVLFNRTDFFSGLGLANDDPQSAISDVLNQAITSSSHCLIQNQVHCGMEQVKQLLSLAATAQTLGHNPQALLATTKAKEIIEQMFNESAVADIDFGELRLLLENIIETGDACHDNVIAIMASLYQGMTEMGTELVNHLAEFGEMMAALQLDIPDFQTQIIPDLMAHLPQPPPQLLDCAERLRLALLHLKKGMELSHTSDAGYPFAKLAQAMGQDFAEAVDPGKAAIAGRAALRAASLLAERLVNQLAATGEPNSFNVEEVRDLLVAIITGSIQQAAGLADQHQAEIKTVLRTLQESTLLDSLIPGDPNAISTIILKSSLDAALTTVLTGLDHESVSNLNFDVSDFLHETQDKLGREPGGEKAATAMEIPLRTLDFLLNLAPQKGLINDAMAVTIVQYVGQAMQTEPVTGFVRNADTRLIPLVEKLGNILQNIGMPDFKTYATEECVDFAVSSIWPNQPLISISLKWGTSYLINTINDDIEQKFHRLQDQEIGIPELVKQLQKIDQFSSLQLPDEIFTVPVTAMISMLENRDQLSSSSDQQRSQAIASIAADSLNIALPKIRVNGCGDLHPLACMINTIGHSSDLIEGYDQEKMVNLGIEIVGISEGWLQKELTGHQIAFTPLLKSFKDIANANSEIEAALTAMVQLPEITRSVIEMANSVPPEWQKYLDIFALDCQKHPLPLSPPDRCSSIKPFNAALNGLEMLRMEVLKNVYAGKKPSSVDNSSSNSWGYLKTMPVLDPPEEPGNTLMSMMPKIDLQDRGDLETPLNGLVAYIDYGRLLLNMASVLKEETGTPRYAEQIIQESIYSGLIGDPGDFFSGAAGGLLMSSELGQPKDSVAAEIVGLFKLPVLGTIAGQLSAGYGVGTNAYVHIRGGDEVPDFANLFDSVPNMPNRTAFEDVANNASQGNPIANVSGHLDGLVFCSENDKDLSHCPLEQLSHSLEFTFHAGISADIINVDGSMTGNLNAHDHTGDLCVTTHSNITNLAGGLWIHPDSEGGTGFALQAGLNLGVGIKQGLAGANIEPGITAGIFANAEGNDITVGSCLTPYLTGYIYFLNAEFKWDESLPISGFPKKYTDNNGNEKYGLGFTFKACANKKQTICSDFYAFQEINTESEDPTKLTVGSGKFPSAEDKPWGGMPDQIIKVCNPLTNCLGD